MASFHPPAQLPTHVWFRFQRHCLRITYLRKSSSVLNSAPGLQVDAERTLQPKEIRSLASDPVLIRIHQLEVEIEYHLRQDHSHLKISKTAKKKVSWRSAAEKQAGEPLLATKTVPRTNKERLKQVKTISKALPTTLHVLFGIIAGEPGRVFPEMTFGPVF